MPIMRFRSRLLGHEDPTTGLTSAGGGGAAQGRAGGALATRASLLRLCGLTHTPYSGTVALPAPDWTAVIDAFAKMVGVIDAYDRLTAAFATALLHATASTPRYSPRHHPACNGRG